MLVRKYLSDKDAVINCRDRAARREALDNIIDGYEDTVEDLLHSMSELLVALDNIAAIEEPAPIDCLKKYAKDAKESIRLSKSIARRINSIMYDAELC